MRSSEAALEQQPQVASEAYGGEVLLEVSNLATYYRVGGALFGQGGKVVRAVDDVSFTLRRGRTLGIVGESGCGKSTLVRTLMRLEERTAGNALFTGIDLFSGQARTKQFVRHMQIVFQDPYASLNPRMSVFDILMEPFRIHSASFDLESCRKRVEQLIEQVGLTREHLDRFPHEFSGGQLQRIGIARALALEPDLIILDEPVSALDVSVQAQIINLLLELQKTTQAAYIFVTHDLSVVRHVSDHILVMYLGQVVESGEAEELYSRPAHPYTVSLLSLEPSFGNEGHKRKRIQLQGDVPSPLDPPSGCRFRTRCWKAQAICKTTPPRVHVNGADHVAACHFPELGSDTK